LATSIEHQNLVDLAIRWLKRQGFSVIASELNCHGSREIPDVYACRETCSAIVEVKVSRSDFLADAKKPERTQGGLGNYRLYLCPAELIQVSDIPPGWGLLYAYGKKIEVKHFAMGNMWPNERHLTENWGPFFHPSNLSLERAALFSIARRLSVRKSEISCSGKK